MLLRIDRESGFRTGGRCSVHLMNWKRWLIWFKDLRTGAGFAVGLLLGLLIFGTPWHLSPNWGDTPTWLLVVLGAVGGWAALGQLSALQKQVASAATEAEDRAITKRREQAEDIDVRRNGTSLGLIENESRRPIRDITCQIMSQVDRRSLRSPIMSGSVVPGVLSGVWDLTPDAQAVSRVEVIRPGSRCGFAFDGLSRQSDQVLVTWFTDDAGFRWQLDEYLHLVQADDESEYRQ